MCKNSKSAQKSAQQRKSRVKVIDTSEMKGCVSMANIRENKKNGKVISFRFTVCLERDVRGKQIRKYTTWTAPADLTPAKARKAAERAADAWEEEVKAEYQKQKKLGSAYRLPPDKRRDDFVSFVNDTWFVLQIRGENDKPNTIAFYKNMTRIISEYFKGSVLQEISPVDIQKYLVYLRTEYKSKLGKSLSAKTLRHQYGTLNLIFGYAEQQEMIAQNPMQTMQFIELCGARGIVLQDKDRIYHDTQGNAFLLTQLIGSIMENGQPKVLPHSMDEILSYRLSGLSFEGRQVLNLVAMFPDYAPYRVLEVVSSKPTLDLLYVCQELCRRAILNEVYDGGSLSLVFTQAEFRDLTYSHIPALSRRILHLNIAQALSALDSAAMPNLDTLTAYHYEQGGDAFHAFQYKVRRFRTYVFFNYALLNGMPSSSESLLDSTPEALESFQKMKKELCHLQRLHPKDSALKAAETDLYYSIGCFCIYRGLYEQGVSAIRKLLQNPALSEEARDLAHEQMIFYGIQTYQTNVMRENIDAALSLTKGKNAARYAINRRYNGYLLVMEGRYEDAREELLRTLVLLHDSAEDEVERRLQSAYAHDYIGEAYRKQGMYARAIEEYQIAIDMIGEYPTSTSTPIFYVDWAMASLAIGDYAAAHNALSNSNRAADNVKEPTGYFRTLYCACNALMCFADGDYRHCASEILQCEQLTKALIVPYDTGILYLTKALLCCYSAQLDIAETPLADVLTEDIAYYCAHCRKCMAGGKAGAFEQELLKRLECGCSNPLPGFLQVTKN